MMKKKLKFYDGTDVKMGFKGQVINGDFTTRVDFTVTEKSIPKLIELGIIVVEEDKKTVKKVAKPATLGDKIAFRMRNIPTDLEYYENLLAEKLSKKDKNIQNAKTFLNSLKQVNMAGYYSLILKEVALFLDNTYEGHIKDSPVIFAISTSSGKPLRLVKSTLKSYHNGYYFRNDVDAIVALKITSSLKKELNKIGRK